MKKMIITLFVIVAAMAANGQKLSLPKVDTITTVKDFEMEVVRECLWRYQHQIKTGYIFDAIGLASVAVGATMKNNDPVKFYAIGGVFFAIGFINTISSNRWLLQASIKPIPGGIAIKIPSKK